MVIASETISLTLLTVVAWARLCARAVFLLVSSILLSYGSSALAEEHESVIINCGGNCSSVMLRVQQLGGTVTNEYKNINAVSASLPIGSRSALLSSDGVLVAYKDAQISSPRPMDQVKVEEAVGTAPVVGQEMRDTNWKIN